MADETEDNTGNEGQSADATRVHHHEHATLHTGVSHQIHESGEGSLLAQTVDLVSQRNRSEIIEYTVANGIEEAPVQLEPNGGVEVLSPVAFDDYRTKPLYISGTAKLGDLDSLIAYVNDHKDGDSVVFADDDRNAPKFNAVLDYSRKGAPDAGGQRFGRHQATHALPLSDQWKAWHDLNAEQMNMPNFARFLEDHIVDVLPPGMITLSEAQQRFVDALGGVGRIADPARLMELATGLKVYEDSVVSQVTNLQSGEGELVLQSNHGDGQGGKLNIPSMFVIAIPVFQNGEPYQLLTRLRYRKAAGGIVFIYELWRDDLVFDHAFDEAVSRVREETSLTVYRGTRGNS